MLTNSDVSGLVIVVNQASNSLSDATLADIINEMVIFYRLLFVVW